MTTFSVWRFDDPDGAIRAARVLERALFAVIGAGLLDSLGRS
jgi:hypothetical protein